jgi:glycosyltransferase involved in cell wall biosynthesis
MSLTVAIPTMDRWIGFLEDQLPIYMDHPKIQYVIVCDENGNDISKIMETEHAMNPKLRLYQNDTVLGVYGNKRECLMKSSTDWVAVLDSDNYFKPDFFDAFFNCLECDGAQAKKTIYCAGENIRFNMDTEEMEDKTSQFSGMNISRDNWNSVIQTPGWNFLLNDGNCIWPRDVLINFPPLPEERIVGTDSIFFMKRAVEAGYTLRVEPTMSYIHTVHSGSHWLQNATVSSRLLSQMDLKIH